MKSHYANLIKNENGITLFELIILIILAGITLPAIFGIMGQIILYHSKNEIILKSVHLAESKMEEILAFKRETNDWYNSIENFSGTEEINGGYTRSINVTHIPDWESLNIDAYEIVIRK